MGKRFIHSEIVEKVPKQTFVGDAEKNDLTECVTINDLIITRGHETPENHPLTILEAFPTVSEVILISDDQKYLSFREKD